MTAPALPRDEQYDAFGNPIRAKAKEATPLPLATGTKSEAGAPSPYANIVPQAPGGAGNYLGQTIQPGAGVDRIALAQKAWDTNIAQSAPAYEASLRQAKQQAAGVGQLGSGQLRTQLGDLALQRSRDMDADRQRLMNEAITGSIADQYKNIDIAQQQQQFQAAQQTTDFGQQLAREQAGLQRELGLGNLGVSQQQAETSRLGTLGNLGVSKEQLAQQERMQQAGFGQESAEAAKAREQQLTLAGREETQAEKQRALQERMQATGLSADAAQAQLDREQQAKIQKSGFEQESAEAARARAQQASQFGETLSLDKQRAALDEKVRTGQLTIEQANQQLDQAKFAEQGKQFGLTLAQQKSMQEAGFSHEAVQSQLQRDLQELMQQKGLTQEAAQALLDREQRERMQEAQFVQETDESALDRGQQITLAQRGEAEALLDRTQQTTLADKANAIQAAANANQKQQIANQLALGTYSNQTERDAAVAQQELAKNQLWAQLAQALGIQNLQGGLQNFIKSATTPSPAPTLITTTQNGNGTMTKHYSDGRTEIVPSSGGGAEV